MKDQIQKSLEAQLQFAKKIKIKGLEQDFAKMLSALDNPKEQEALFVRWLDTMSLGATGTEDTAKYAAWRKFLIGQ